MNEQTPASGSSKGLAWMSIVYGSVSLIAGTACMIEGARLLLLGLSQPAEIKVFFNEGGGEFWASVPGAILFIAGFILAIMNPRY